MTHMEDGRLLAWLDGELDEEEGARVQAWLGEDDGAARRLARLRGGTETVRSALGRLDIAPPTERVRRRLQNRRAPLRPGWATARNRLAQAAVLVLLFAGAVSAAIPGSPVRRWIDRTFGEAETASATRTAPGPADVEAPAGSEPVGLWMSADEGALRIDLEDVPEGTEILVTLVDGARGGVAAPQGTSLRSGEGQIRAAVHSGPVRIEMPRALRQGSLRVDGREYLAVRDGALDILVPSGERTGDRIRFLSDH